jgi:AcrR family transcriptional regulator
MATGKEVWISAGYKAFGLEGVKGLKIEELARKVGISKSSFYHHFADLEYFVEELLKHHLNQTQVIAQKEKEAQSIHPELIDILVEHKADLLFNRQLRVGRENKLFADAISKSDQIAGNHFINVWQKDLNIKFTQQQLEGAFGLAIENFYLQITHENLNKEWLGNYFEDLKKVVVGFA